MISYSSSVSATYGFISKSILVNTQSMDMFSVLPQTRRYRNGFLDRSPRTKVCRTSSLKG